MHGSIVDIYVVEGQPATDEVSGQTAPVRVVLVWMDGTSVVGGFEQGLIMEQLNVRPDQILGDVEDRLMVEQSPEGEGALAHLHDLQHLFFGALVVTLCGAAVGREIAVLRRLSSLVEGTVVFGAQFIQLAVCNQLTYRDVAFATEGVDLVLREGAVGVLLLFGGFHWQIVLASSDIFLKHLSA